MHTLVSDGKYRISFEYETVYLTIEGSEERIVVIGDFYGDPDVAMIDRNGRFCAVGGCGVIIYYLRPPFLPYRYGCSSEQWVEYCRDGDRYVTDIRQVDDDTVEVFFEDGERMRIVVG